MCHITTVLVSISLSNKRQLDWRSSCHDNPRAHCSRIPPHRGGVGPACVPGISLQRRWFGRLLLLAAADKGNQPISQPAENLRLGRTERGATVRTAAATTIRRPPCRQR